MDRVIATDVLESLQPSDHEDSILKENDELNNITSSFLNNSNSSVDLFDESNSFPENTNDSQNFDSLKPNNDNNNEAIKEEENGTEQLNEQKLSDIDKSQILAAIHLLRKYNLNATENILLKETANIIDENDIKSL